MAFNKNSGRHSGRYRITFIVIAVLVISSMLVGPFVGDCAPAQASGDSATRIERPAG